MPTPSTIKLNARLQKENATLRAQLAEVTAERDTLRDAMKHTGHWPPRDVVKMLVESVKHLLDDHDCDAHGHEQVRRAQKHAAAWLLASTPKEPR